MDDFWDLLSTNTITVILLLLFSIYSFIFSEALGFLITGLTPHMMRKIKALWRLKKNMILKRTNLTKGLNLWQKNLIKSRFRYRFRMASLPEGVKSGSTVSSNQSGYDTKHLLPVPWRRIWVEDWDDRAVVSSPHKLRRNPFILHLLWTTTPRNPQQPHASSEKKHSLWRLYASLSI